MIEQQPDLIKAKELIASVKGQHFSVEERRDKAIKLAGLMIVEANRTQKPLEKKQQKMLARMMNDPAGKVFTTCMTDQCFRSERASRIASQLTYLIKKMGVPSYLPFSRKVGLTAFRCFSSFIPALTVPLTKKMLREETSYVILPGESELLEKHMKKRRKENIRVNLNHLGEAILGEDEAKKKLQLYIDDLNKPDVEYISVKISTICSQLNLLATKETLAVLSERLQLLYRTAAANFYTRSDGTKTPKFVNLDMEEYRDLNLTVELFQSVLNEREFFNHAAGIVLQSYLPDSFLMQKQLTEWAKERVRRGGAPIKIRIVKGANLAMETVEAALRGWEQAPYACKADVDANFKRMLNYGMQEENAKAAHLGIGSHNLFDIAYALLLRKEMNVEPFVCFEMLEGMADHIRRIVHALSGDMLLYCPAATKEEFGHAIAYLVRRLDENTAPENFLRHAFGLQPGTKTWDEQVKLFSAACNNADTVSFTPRRQQNRNEPPIFPDPNSSFHNEPDTDWALPANQKWAEKILFSLKNHKFDPIPLEIGASAIPAKTRETAIGEDPSKPGQELYTYALATEDDIEKAIDTAQKAAAEWAKTPIRERSHLLALVAQEMREHRLNLIHAMVADGGKTIPEADVEISEAIDFAEYYRRNIEELHFLDDLSWSPKGVVLITPPWNFPCSISAGGILAALATGNSVIFKPAPEVVLSAWTLVNLFWNAGVSRTLLQFLPCKENPVGTKLIQDPRINTVILTGGTETAKLFLKLRPGLDLMAETGGKNALIITGLSDRDLSIKDLIQSAFGHAGQKCSACSLGILEAEVYDDTHFLNLLKDAAQSLKVVSQWDPSSKINPLIRPPEGALKQGLTLLEQGESWLLEPKQDPENPQLWSPGIKLGVKPGSFSHQTEFFGPVLSLIRAKNLSEAIEIANATPYGLTSGIHSLDDREIELWSKSIITGNGYINRSITGAIVQRQPFGGTKKSSFGKGMKAGGPNYLSQLMHKEQIALPREVEIPNAHVALLDDELNVKFITPEDKDIWKTSIGSYAFYWTHYFSKQHDPSQVLGQDNLLCYLPQTQMTLRIEEGNSDMDVRRILAASATCGTHLTISGTEEVLSPYLGAPWVSKIPLFTFLIESEAEFISQINAGKRNRVRFLSTPTSSILNALAENGCSILQEPVLANGRIELLNYLREMSLSHDYHRYGNLGERELSSTKIIGNSKAATCGEKCGCK